YVLESHDPPPTPTAPLSLHDALPISTRGTRRPHAGRGRARPVREPAGVLRAVAWRTRARQHSWRHAARRGRPVGVGGCHCRGPRSEEHTSELQSRENLVCRLLLEKKK